MYIDGKWTQSCTGGTFENFNPYDGEVIATIASGSREDAVRAIEAATGAFPKWSQSTPGERRRLFLKAADVLEKRQQEIVQILIEESGATFGWSMFQLGFTPGLLREAAAQTYTAAGEILPADLPGAFFMTLRKPVGVVVGIAPWNAPLILSMRAVALPIAYGNTVVLKASEDAPLSAGLLVAEIFEEAGFPPGVINVLTHAREQAEEVGEALISHPRVRRINFTGSTEVGRIIAEKAARHLKRVVLELGGKNPLVILKDADLDYAVDAACFGSFLHQGQICMSAGKLIVERDISEQFAEKLAKKARRLKVGNPKDPDTIIGPLINKRALERVHSDVTGAAKAGAAILAGGKFDGLCYHPTVLSGVTSEMEIFHKEVFGPVAPIVEVSNVEEAIQCANDTRYGLSAGILTSDFDKGLAIAEKLETGMVHINDSPVHDEPQVPFGGVKESGWGRLGGKAALEEFTELRWISVQRQPRHYPF
ncbi:MAG: aldehyde dehydrogenase family protein [Acidobacteria bacterium]|nr:aldehyde dehydrogenase family protein [Acidobacteriota bacterium]